MNVRQFAQAQQRPLGPLHKLIRAVLHAIGVPVNDDHVNEVAILLYRPMLHARDLNYTAALRYLHDLDPEIIAPRPRDYPIEAIRSTVKRVVTELRIEGDPITESTRSDTRVIETARKAIDGQVGRQVLEPAREVLANIGESEEHVRYGWARVLVGAYSCSFCAMLASRGPVYTSRAAALGRGGSPLSLYHVPYVNDNGKTVGGFCDCTAVIVPKGRRWEGQDAHGRLQDLWLDTTDGRSNEDARNAFRRTWDRKVKNGETHQFLAESVQPKPAAA
jgi:hypothetical protein